MHPRLHGTVKHRGRATDTKIGLPETRSDRPIGVVEVRKSTSGICHPNTEPVQHYESRASRLTAQVGYFGGPFPKISTALPDCYRDQENSSTASLSLAEGYAMSIGLIVFTVVVLALIVLLVKGSKLF
jgi:hypothetical protein